jgi:transglutaminase superfamily protein
MGFYRSLRRKAETWHSLSTSDRGLLMSAACLLPVVAASLKIVGLQRTQSWLAGNALAPMRPATAQTRSDVRRAVQIVATAYRLHPVPSSCLPRAVLLWSLLQRRGIAAYVRIGVRYNTQGQFQSHAWLEWNGEVLNDAADVAGQFLPFNSLAFDQVKLPSPCGSE